MDRNIKRENVQLTLLECKDSLMMSVSPKPVHQENSDTKEIEKPKEEREEFGSTELLLQKPVTAMVTVLSYLLRRQCQW